MGLCWVILRANAGWFRALWSCWYHLVGKNIFWEEILVSNRSIPQGRWNNIPNCHRLCMPLISQCPWCGYRDKDDLIICPWSVCKESRASINMRIMQTVKAIFDGCSNWCRSLYYFIMGDGKRESIFNSTSLKYDKGHTVVSVQLMYSTKTGIFQNQKWNVAWIKNPKLQFLRPKHVPWYNMYNNMYDITHSFTDLCLYKPGINCTCCSWDWSPWALSMLSLRLLQ